MKFLTVSSFVFSAVSALQSRSPNKAETPFSHKGTTSKDPNKTKLQQVWPGYANPDPFHGSKDTAGGGGGGGDPEMHKLKQMWPGYAIPDPFKGDGTNAPPSDDKRMKPVFPDW